jgi:hypothetical protein
MAIHLHLLSNAAKGFVLAMTTLVLSGKNSTIVALLAALLVTGLILATGMCMYESNDDMVMIGLLAGKQGMVASPDAIFLSLPLSILLHKLYGINGTLPWYGMLMYSLLVVSCTIGLRIIINSRTDLPIRIIVMLAFFSFHTYLVCRLNFAAVSLFLWFVAIASVSQKNLEKLPPSPVDYLGGALLGISYLIRPDIFSLSLAFSLPLIATFIVSPAWKRLLATVVPLLIMILLASGVSQFYRTNNEYRAYDTFNKNRASFTDTPVAEPNARTVRALIQTGWTRADYVLAHNWWFHDSSLFSAEKLSTFMNDNKENVTSPLSLQDSRKALHDHRWRFLAVLFCLIALASGTSWNREIFSKRSLILIGSLLATLSGFVLLTAIRFPPRVALPLFMYFILLGTVFMPFLFGKWQNHKLIRISGLIVCSSAIMYLAVHNIQSLTKEASVAQAIKRYTDGAVAQLQRTHGADTIFLSANAICSFFYPEAAHPLKEYRDMIAFKNFPMGWTIASPPYQAFLRDNGFGDRTTVVSRMINNPRLIIAFWETPDKRFEPFAEQFQDHLQNHYSTQFPGMNLKLAPVLDLRKVIGDLGWVFFTIHATPQATS